MSEKIIAFIFLFSPLFAEAFTLKVVVKGPWATRTTEVSRNKKDWICKTEVNPYVVAKQIPYSEELLTNMTSSNKKDCRDSVFIVDLTNQKVKKITGCADDLTIAPFLKELDKNCRHSF